MESLMGKNYVHKAVYFLICTLQYCESSHIKKKGKNAVMQKFLIGYSLFDISQIAPHHSRMMVCEYNMSFNFKLPLCTLNFL